MNTKKLNIKKLNITRRRVLIFAWLLLVFLLAWYAVVRILSPFNQVRLRHEPSFGKETSLKSDELRVAIYNIAHGRGAVENNWEGGNRTERTARLERIAQLLKESTAEIVILNEVDFDASWSGRVNQAEFIARKAGFPYWVEQRNIDIAIPFFSFRFGNAVLSKFPITDAQPVDLPTHREWETLLAGKKRATVCMLKLAEGEHLRVMPIHLSHRVASVRLESAEAIGRVRQQSDVPLIAAGDFNATLPGSPGAVSDERTPMSVLLEGGEFSSLPLTEATSNDFTYPSTTPEQTIDWILVPQPWKLIAKRSPRDHGFRPPARLRHHNASLKTDD